MEGLTMASSRSRAAARVVAGLFLAAGPGLAARAQTPAPPPSAAPKGAALSGRATGAFDVKLTPQGDDKETGVGRMTADKVYHGDLSGTARGEMLSSMTAVKGSAVYVAIERVSGTLRGRTGTFVLHHVGVMTRGTPNLTIAVVPDSGTGQLAGITGKMGIIIADGKHSYDFEYTLPDNP
jgi:hypothetical protein